MAKNENEWWNSFKPPTRKQYMKYLRSQQGQFGPMIGTLLNQLRSTSVEKDPTVRMFEQLQAGLPSKEAISSEYKSRLGNLSSYIQNLDTAKGGRAVSDIVAGLGSALGVEGAADVASAAGTVSGVGGLGGDVINKALLMGAEASFGGLEAERLGEAARQRQEFGLGAAEARKGVRAERQNLARMLAEVRGQRAAAAPNPLELYSTLLGIRGQERALRGGGGYGGGSSSSDTTGGGGGGAGNSYADLFGRAVTEEQAKNMLAYGAYQSAFGLGGQRPDQFKTGGSIPGYTNPNRNIGSRGRNR